MNTQEAIDLIRTCYPALMFATGKAQISELLRAAKRDRFMEAYGVNRAKIWFQDSGSFKAQDVDYTTVERRAIQWTEWKRRQRELTLTGAVKKVVHG